MNLNKIPEQLVIDLLERSFCAVQVAAVIVDINDRIFSWGWNHVGDGFGCHAEMYAMDRANSSRFKGATIYVAAKRNKNSMIVTARPCEGCMPRVIKHGMTFWWRDKTGVWRND